MSFENLSRNISEARRLVRDLKKISKNAKYSDARERLFYLKGFNSMVGRLKIINNAIPSLISDIIETDNKKLEQDDIAVVSYLSPDKSERNYISIKKEDKEKYLKELSLSEDSLKKISPMKKEMLSVKPSRLASVSSFFFGGLASRCKGSVFDDLRNDLKGSGSRFLLVTYLAIAFFISTFLFLISSVALSVFIFFNLSALMFIWIPFLVFFLSLVGFYVYPAFGKSTIQKKISNELPFSIIYMSAIAEANADPTRIFRVVADSPEYPNIGMVMKRILNQIEIYGYDLVTSLRSVSKTTINKKLSQLLNGMATNIASGSSLKNFLEKESENLLSDYKMDRVKYNSVATTFMDVYISVLITAPLIMVMLIVIMSLTSLNIGGLSTNTLVAISIGLVAFVNVLFLIFLQIKQPEI